MSYTPNGANTSIASNIYTNGAGAITAVSLSAVLYYIVALLSGSYAPTADNNTALRAVASTSYTKITRLGYSTPGDSPKILYTPAETCPYGVSDNGGSCVASSDGKFWVANFSSPIDPRTWGAKCDGVTDDTSAFVASYATAGVLRGGTVVMPAAVCVVAKTANMDVSQYPNVTLQGNAEAVGYTAAPASAPFTLKIGSAAYSAVFGAHQTVNGVRVTANTVIDGVPTTRQAIQRAQAFVGTGITFAAPSGGRATDIGLFNVQVNGFAVGINSSSVDRFTMDNVRGDDTEFFLGSGCLDTCSITNSEAWPFLTYPAPPQTSNVQTVTSYSGLVEVTLTATPATPLVTNDIVIIGGVVGATGANGRCTVTVISGTQFTCQGSAFGGSYVSGGIAYLSTSLRTGPAFAQTNGNWVAYTLTDYGHDTSFYYGNGVTDSICVACWSDGDTANSTFADPVPIGVDIEGDATAVTHIGGTILNKGISVKQNSTNSNQPTVMSGMSAIGATGAFAGVAGSAIDVLQGAVLVSGSNISAVVSGGSGYYAYVADAATALDLQGNRINGFAGTMTNPIGQISYQTIASDCPKVSVNGVVGPCPWTPVLTDGTHQPTYSTQAGSYTIIGGRGQGSATASDVYGAGSHGLVTAQFDISTTALGSLSGPLTITGLPVSATNSFGTVGGYCTIARLSAVTPSTNYTSVIGQVSPNTAYVILSQLSSTGFGTAQLPASTLGAASEIGGACSYPSW